MTISFPEIVKSELAAHKKASRRVLREIERTLLSYRAQVKALIRDPATIGPKQRFELATAQRTVAELQTILRDAGIGEVLQAHANEFAALTTQARAYLSEFGELPRLGGASAQALDAYIDFSQNRLSEIVPRRLIEPVQTALFQSTFGNLSREAVIDFVITAADNLSMTQAATLVDDSYRQYQRQVAVVTAEDLGLEIYHYQGPLDDITSEQCESILSESPHGVPGMYYRSEISVDMHPALKEDPLIAGGHPNCRHKFYPVSLEYAKEQGFKP